MKTGLLFLALLLASCGSDKPDEKVDFVVQGAAIRIEGRLKPGAKVTATESKAAVQMAVRMLERK